MKRRLVTLAAAASLVLWIAVAVKFGFWSNGFVLNDESAARRLMETRHVADLQEKLRTRVICFVERSTPSESFLCLGEDHGTHTVRLRACRVTADGRVWVNADKTLLEDRWVLIN